MNRRLPALDNIALISNSDAHSPSKIGRECNVFDTELSYQGIMKAIKSFDKNKFLGTVEFFPQEGKYYHDGHMDCKCSFTPKQAKVSKGLCNVCGKELTRGVLSRIEDLAGADNKKSKATSIPFVSAIALIEIIAFVREKRTASKKVIEEYHDIINKAGAELDILTGFPKTTLEKHMDKAISDAIMAVRHGKVTVIPGYDGQYGVVKI